MRLGVIEPVPVGDPVTYCYRMVICAKKDGKPRRTMDIQSLNANATRETHHTQSSFHQARSVPAGMKITVFDAWNGYHSIALHPDDRYLTTFITWWGRYRYRVAPQGYVASGDGYSRRFDEIVSDVPDKTKCIDDTLLWATDLEASFHQATKWLDLCGRSGITLNPEKFIFGADTIEFAGFEVTRDSVRPSQKYLCAIKSFPTPQNITDIRSWFGLINQVAYTFSMTERMSPFHSLLKPDTPFQWDDTLQKLFEGSKSVILDEICKGVKIFDKTKPTCLVTDWSKDGIGFWLLQKHCDCQTTPASKPFRCHTGWQIVLVGSRFTHSAESRYRPIEGEALAVADALDRTRYFVLGCKDLTVVVDHKPLLGILGNRSLEAISNPRLRNLKEKTLRYQFKMMYIPGVKNKASDCMFRRPSGTRDPDRPYLEDDVTLTSANCTTYLDQSPRNFMDMIRTSGEMPTEIDRTLSEIAGATLDTICTITWDRVCLATNSNDTILRLVEIIEDGIPESREDFPQALREFYQFRDDLYTVDSVVMYNGRVVIPPSLREECLIALHAAHGGCTSMLSRAECSIFWPGITPAYKE